jgi:hypothetical protein
VHALCYNKWFSTSVDKFLTSLRTIVSAVAVLQKPLCNCHPLCTHEVVRWGTPLPRKAVSSAVLAGVHAGAAQLVAWMPRCIACYATSDHWLTATQPSTVAPVTATHSHNHMRPNLQGMHTQWCCIPHIQLTNSTPLILALTLATAVLNSTHACRACHGAAIPRSEAGESCWAAPSQSTDRTVAVNSRACQGQQLRTAADQTLVSLQGNHAGHAVMLHSPDAARE